jgi:PucR family transcriptional regulator, purine catabolism regulatory protein
MLTVGDLIKEMGLGVLAGESGLDLPVRWVHISELLDPTEWLSGGELLLTTGMQLDSPEQQREFVLRLADHHLAGLGIGTGFRHATVPKAMVEAAAERDFPVFEIPYETPFIAITEAAFTQLVNEHYAVLRRAIAAHERLERILLSEQGLDALGGALASLIGGTVLVFDGRGEPSVRHKFRRLLTEPELRNLQSEVRERARRREARAFVPSIGAASDAGGGLALPVTAEGAPQVADGSSAQPEAWLVAIKDAGALSDFDRLTLHQAVTIVALELLRGRVAGETERRLAGDVLRAVVAGELAGGDLVRRLEPFGLGSEVAMIVAERVSANGRNGGGGLETELAAALREESVLALVATTRGLACSLISGMPEEDLFEFGARVRGRLGSPEVRVGVGRAVPAGEARRSFHEARCALEGLALGVAGTQARRNGSGTTDGVATYKDLGSFQLLLSLQDDEALRLFCDSILGPIESSEGRYGGELIRSLEAFIEENGQWERAARRLYCHRHTLRYRIRRIETLTGRSLANARDRIEFWLALRGRELVGFSREGTLR